MGDFYGQLTETRDFACGCAWAYPRPVRKHSLHPLSDTIVARRFRRDTFSPLLASESNVQILGGKIFLYPPARWKGGSEVEAWCMVGGRRYGWNLEMKYAGRRRAIARFYGACRYRSRGTASVTTQKTRHSAKNKGRVRSLVRKRHWPALRTMSRTIGNTCATRSTPSAAKINGEAPSLPSLFPCRDKHVKSNNKNLKS